MPAVRRLAAILAADVAGYSRLMGADEEGTHERLKAHRREVVDPKIREHLGRIVKTTGDGLLAEFPSVVDAVRCAADSSRSVPGVKSAGVRPIPDARRRVEERVFMPRFGHCDRDSAVPDFLDRSASDLADLEIYLSRREK
jgi:class 3 adenylate cyclase